MASPNDPDTTMPGLQPPDLANGSPLEVSISPRRVLLTLFLICFAAEIAWVLLDYFVNYGRATNISQIRRLFNTTREDGICSWFAVTQTAFVAATVWFVFFASKWRKRRVLALLGWLLLAVFFTYMAIDDGSALHERMGSVFKEWHKPRGGSDGDPSWGAKLLDFFPSYPWQLIYLPFYAVMGLFVLGFLWFELKSRSLMILVACAIVCFTVAVGMDFVEGLDEGHDWDLYTILSDRFDLDDFCRKRFRRSGYDSLRHFSKSIEENVEALGMTLLLITFLAHWMKIVHPLNLRFERKKASS